jgi:hypothetical protein
LPTQVPSRTAQPGRPRADVRHADATGHPVKCPANTTFSHFWGNRPTLFPEPPRKSLAFHFLERDHLGPGLIRFKIRGCITTPTDDDPIELDSPVKDDTPFLKRLSPTSCRVRSSEGRRTRIARASSSSVGPGKAKFGEDRRLFASKTSPWKGSIRNHRVVFRCSCT